MPEKELLGQSANAVAGTGFVMTLSNIDTFVSIAVGCAGLVAAVYSVIWHRVKIKNARKSNEQSKRVGSGSPSQHDSDNA